MRVLCVALTVALFTSGGCTSEPEPGLEGSACYGNGTCHPGLECVADICRSDRLADAGPVGTDAGPVGTDAGPVGTDAGSVGTDAGCPTGSQGCACHGNNTCDGALVCRSGTCEPENCTDECAPMQTTPACSADERSTVTCEDSDADGCLEETVQEMCTGWCDYFQSQYQCVGCRDDEDCADPIRNRCASAARSCESRPQWSITTLSYSDGASSAQRNYSNCYFCDATYLPSSSHSLIRFQQGGGYTVWSLYVHNGATVGSETLQPGSPATGSYFFLSESDSSLPARFQGSYTQVSGTVNFTQANLADGGAVAGTATVVLQHQTRAESRVTLTANFYARFPP